MSCITEITDGITLDCLGMNAPIGSDKDLILVNYADFDKTATLAAGNREDDDLNGNEGGLTAIILKTGALQYIYRGTDYSVIPTVTPEIKEDGDTWFAHQILFTAYSKQAKDRKTLEDLDGAIVIAIVKERSTGLYELFGMDQGLKVSSIERTYVGNQTSNFYQVTLLTPEIAVVKESGLGELALSIEVT
jgi:hypothetical protein